MTEKKGNSLLETRRKNRIYIKDMIYKTEPAIRTDVAETLGLTLPTITTSVNEMIAEGILEEVPIPEEKLVNAAGRRPNAIQFVKDAAYAVGVELGPYETSAVLMNLRGEVIVSSIRAAGDASYEIMLIQVHDQIQNLLREAQCSEDLPRQFDRKKLLGVEIGISGYVDRVKGIIRIHRNTDWNGRMLRQDLERLLHLPVALDNNVRLRAIGYDMSQKGMRPDSFAYLYVSRGIACPILEKENVLTGYTSGAGEVGHMILSVDYGTEKQECGENGTECYVEDLAGEKAIIKACAKKLREGGAPILASRTGGKTTLEFSDILEAFDEGDEDVSGILRRSMDCLGIALANIVNLVNPGFVIVDAYMMKNEKLQEIFQRAAQKRFFGVNEDEVRIFFLPFEHFTGAKGAAYDVIQRLFLNV